MKIHFLLAFIIFFTWSSYSQEPPSSNIITIPASYADREESLLKATTDSLYKFETPDIIFVPKRINDANINVIQNIIVRESMISEVVENYTRLVKENFDLQKKLETNFAQADSLDSLSYTTARTALVETQKSLEFTINSLEKATNHLDNLEKIVKAQRRKTVFEKILIGVAGVGAGVLIGVSL